ncbi:UMP kinase [Candidatus Pacearchaeota archaeon]|nr:UMP kinase [Candidatus Pacearchaeota archaeon]
MKKRVIVLSLGGSLIIPDKVNLKFLKEFKKVISKNTKKYKFIIVCGGGSIARKYISALQDKPYQTQSTAGIAATRTNAKFMSCFFSQDSFQKIPQEIKKIKKFIKKQDIVFCGALEFKPKQTTDSNAAEIAKYFKTFFINLTNVPGLYDKNPSKNKNAKFISKISWKEFDRMSKKIKFKPGQHFVLDQTSSGIILKNKIKTYILGKNPKQLDNLLNNKKFKATIIQG